MASSSSILVLAVGSLLAQCTVGQVLPLNAGCGIGTGYQLSPASLPIAQAGLPFAQAGLPFAQAGLPFAQARLPIAQAGLQFAQTGLPIAQAGLPNAQAGLQIAQAGLPLTSSAFPAGFSFANLPASGTCVSPPAPAVPFVNNVSFAGNLPITGFTITTGLPFGCGWPTKGALPVGNLPVVEPVISNGVCSSLLI